MEVLYISNYNSKWLISSGHNVSLISRFRHYTSFQGDDVSATCVMLKIFSASRSSIISYPSYILGVVTDHIPTLAERCNLLPLEVSNTSTMPML